MAKTSPFIPYELGKYLLLLMGILGIAHFGIRSYRGILMVILITPAVFYDFSGHRIYFDVINYYIAPLAVGLGITFADRLKIKENELNQVLKLIWLGCLASLIFSMVKTPDLEDVDFKLGANFETTGGHSSNQVSTILGLGMFLTYYSIFKKLKYSGNAIFDILIFVGFAFQGLLSFSRGGIVVPTIGILFLFLNNGKSQSANSNYGRTFIIGLISLVLLFGVFQIANKITNGNLLLRYQGETAGTLGGYKEQTLNNVVSGRIDIFEKDIGLWLNNFFTGVGCGSSKYLRGGESRYVASHVELSRLLADHGLAGLFYAIIFFSIPIYSYQLNRNSAHRILLVVLLIIAILTTFHAAMRTFVTPLLMILGMLKVEK